MKNKIAVGDIVYDYRIPEELWVVWKVMKSKIYYKAISSKALEFHEKYWGQINHTKMITIDKIVNWCRKI